MGRSKFVQETTVSPDSVAVSLVSGRGRSASSTPSSGRARAAIETIQPEFVHIIARGGGRSRVSHTVVDTDRTGDIRIEDIWPGAIKTVHIGDATITTAKIEDLAVTNAKVTDLSANKIVTGTLDASLVTVSSTDGKMTMTGNIFQVKDGSDVIQVTLGKYDGTNYGMVVGSNPASPTVLITSVGFEVKDGNAFQVTSPGGIIFNNSGKTLAAPFKYVINQLQLTPDSTGGLNINGDLAIGAQAPDYGGGHDVIFISNRASAPGSNPTNGGIMYVESGALKYRGSSGTVSTLAVA